MALVPYPQYQQQSTYPASHDRWLLENTLIQAGVVEAGDMKVTAAGGSYQLNIAAGVAWVKAAGTRMGMYMVTNDATDTYTVAAAHATNPRIDQVYCRVRDASDLGDVTNSPLFGIEQGVATSGATLANRNGAAALPANSIRLADILVPSTASGFSGTWVTNTHIRDRRPWAHGAYFHAVGVTADPTRAAGAAAVIPEMTVTGEFSGAPCEVHFSIQTGNSTASQPITFDVAIDGVAQTNATWAYTTTGASFGTIVDVSGNIFPTAGRHTIDIRWTVGGGTQSASGVRRQLIVRERLAATSSNSGA